MADVAHKNLTGSDLHENKGVAGATDNTVATASSGATVWQTLGLANIATEAKAFQGQLLHIQDQQTSGTHGGTFTSGAWRTRTLNTKVTDELTVTLSSNQFALPAGTYYCEGSAPAYSVYNHKVRLYNITDATTLLVGSSEYCYTMGNRSYIYGRFTIAGTKTIEFQHRSTGTQATTGLGYATSISVSEVYADLKIWKVA